MIFTLCNRTVYLLLLLSTVHNILLKIEFVNGEKLTNALDDETGKPFCEEFVKLGQCTTNPEEMMKSCKKACVEWSEAQHKNEIKKDPEKKFFDLYSKNSTGSMIEFDRFEGYITVVASVAKMCDKGATEQGYKAYEDLKNIWPYNVEFVVFTFEHPEIDYDKPDLDCTAHEDAFEKKGRKIFVMEETSINGKNTHRVYKYLKELFETNELPTNIATFFIINPDGTTIELIQGASEQLLKSHVLRHVKALEQEL